MAETQESIYNIVPAKQLPKEKPPLYHSKYRGSAPPTASTFHQTGTSWSLTSNIGGDALDKLITDKGCKTFGQLPGSNKSTPQDFLKKGACTPPVQTLAELKRCNPELLKPSTLKPKLKGPVPKSSDTPMMNLTTSKNFVIANAVESILVGPKKVLDVPRDYLKKEDYGKVPKYLAYVKEDIEAEQEYIRTLVEQRLESNKPQVQPMDDNERSELMSCLKEKWDALNNEYQTMTHIMPTTVGQMKRKSKYEAELSQIEKDLQNLNRKNVLVDRY